MQLIKITNNKNKGIIKKNISHGFRDPVTYLIIKNGLNPNYQNSPMTKD